jgi:hypothetical protein
LRLKVFDFSRHERRKTLTARATKKSATMPDEDLASVVVYLRSLPHARNQLPPSEIVFLVKYFIRNAPEPITSPVPQPDLSDRVKRGSFLVNLVGCADCHTPVDNHHQPIRAMEFGGGQVLQGVWGKPVASANLTPDPSGIPYDDEALFIRAMRTGCWIAGAQSGHAVAGAT